MSPDIPASVRARLLSLAKSTGEDFERTLARFAAERFLFRLGSSSARERCILKGASLLGLWMPEPYRATRDVDLLAHGAADDEAIAALVSEVCAVEYPEDGLRFDLAELRIAAIRPDEEYSGKRARFRAFLGNARIAVQVDFGVGDALALEPELVEYPTLIHALKAPLVRAYPREAVVAEKFEAMIKLDIRNSRMKDFHDIWALSGAFAFSGAALLSSVAACFERRGTAWTSEFPPALTPAFYSASEMADRWRYYRRSSSILLSPPLGFEVVGERIIEFLAPIRDAIMSADALDKTWPPGGPWKENDEG